MLFTNVSFPTDYRITEAMAMNEIRIKACVQDIVKTDLEIHARLEEVKICGTLAQLDDVNTDVRIQMQKLKKKIEEFERVAKEQEKEDDKLGLLAEVEKYRKQYLSTQTAVKKANLSCMFALERKERDQLMDSKTDPELRKRQNRENLARTAGSITENLSSLNKLMADNVTSSELTNQALYTSSDTLGSADEEFKGMAAVTQTSRKLLTKYNRRELTDRLLIFLAVAFFLGTVVYILKRGYFDERLKLIDGSIKGTLFIKYIQTTLEFIRLQAGVELQERNRKSRQGRWPESQRSSGYQ